MRLIDADDLDSITVILNNHTRTLARIDAPTVCDIDAIRAEIKKIYNEEKDIDVRWAQGFKYSLQIIDKHTKGERE